MMDDVDPKEARKHLLAACAAEPETDIGNGRRFRRRFGDLAAEHLGAASHLAMAVAHIGWHVFDGCRWKEDEDESMIRPLVHAMAEAIRQEPAMIEPSEADAEIIGAGEVAAETLKKMKSDRQPRLPDPGRLAMMRDLELAVEHAQIKMSVLQDARSSRRRHAKSTAGSSKLTNALQEARPYIARKVEDLNSDRLSVNCLSGTIDFVKVEDEESDPSDPRYRYEARLRPHRQTDYITKLVAANWQEGVPAQPKQFLNFLKRVQPDPMMRAFLKRFSGYVLTGLIVEQVLLFFYGIGSNGKSTFTDLLCHIMGDYAVTLSIDSFSGESRKGGGEATPDLARLPGARLVSASEPEANVKLKDALIKMLTGGERIPVRRLREDFFEVDPHFKIILSGNHKPVITDDSDGIWRRVLLVPWLVQIPKPERDRGLIDRLRGERDQVFAWMVEGAVDYLNFGLDVPPSVYAASEEYRQESDPVGAFIRMACLVTGEPQDEEKPFDLYLSYERFANEEGVFKFTSSTFAKRFAAACNRSWPGTDGTMKQFHKAKNSTTVYRGIRIKPEWIPSGGGHPSSQHDAGRGEGWQ